MQQPHRCHWSLVCHGVGYQSADRRGSIDAVAVFDGHSVRHETSHREAGEEHTVLIYRILYGQTVEESHQKAGIVDCAVHEGGVPHGAVAFVDGLWYDDHPVETVCNLLEIMLAVDMVDVVA